MKKVTIMIGVIVLVLACVGASYQIGRNAGFQMGSEWAMMQADIVAEEAGVYMPVYLKDGKFTVVFKQQRGIYKRARELAEQYEDSKVQPAMNPQHDLKEHQEAKDSI